MSDFSLLFSDDDVLVVGKPAGLLTVRGKGADKQDCLHARLQAQFDDVRVVHRLDQDTSGIVVFARHLAAQQQLNKQFEQRVVNKHYIALVYGHIAQMHGEIDAPLSYDASHPPLHKVDYEHGQHALTQWQVLSRHSQSTRVLLKPITGRSHQLRVHMQLLGHPIVGDTLYAPPPAVALSPRLCLHAESLEFNHPTSFEPQHFVLPAPF
ncbi:MAG: RluA family pseudouridine synthase [Moraxellaceae bacterium]|nr:RluA family pseudouridine synthase [Pseudomonadales bacterium]MCP5174701.1 RluA family pseudouridine synthase [Moraxellaceae bacterium]MCP5176511.1 RluA family pseudouridine synthase [Moraxellaceae bacterium]